MSRVLPILFNTEMVQAILDGRKTVTRRIMKPQPLFYTGRKYIFADDKCPSKWVQCDNIIETYQYQPGDILYVRETWAINPRPNIFGNYYYKANRRAVAPEETKWKPSIHMPKDAARIWLRVTDVRVERLQDMWASDVSKEGLLFIKPYTADEMLQEFKKIWNSTIKKSEQDLFGWDANPWVWVIE